MSATYPPEPWYLGGSLVVGVFLVPTAELPAAQLELVPAGRRPLSIAGRTVVGVAFAHYVPGGALSYDELLVAVPSFGSGGIRVTIPQIWVNSPASLAGGRALWGIPKQLAEFVRREQGDRVATTMHESDEIVASVRGRYGLPLVPGMSQLALPTVQDVDGTRTLSHNRIVGRITGLRASWNFAPDGPLAWLSGRRSLVNVALRDASIIFGMDVTRS